MENFTEETQGSESTKAKDTFKESFISIRLKIPSFPQIWLVILSVYVLVTIKIKLWVSSHSFRYRCFKITAQLCYWESCWVWIYSTTPMISRSPLAKEERFPRSVGAAQTHTVRTAKCNTTLMYTCTWRQIPVFTQCCSSVRIEKRSSCHSKASVQWWHKHRTSLWLSAACLTFYSVCKRASQIRTLGGSNAAFLKEL